MFIKFILNKPYKHIIRGEQKNEILQSILFLGLLLKSGTCPGQRHQPWSSLKS